MGRQTARGAVYPLVELFWASLFKAVGRAMRVSARVEVPAGADSVLVVAPHPDDETLGCGGTIALHTQAGEPVCVLIATDGRLSRAGRRSAEEMKAVRAREAEAAAEVLGVDTLAQLALEEGNWPTEALTGRLAELLDRLQPSIVYAPSCVDFHPEHARAAAALAGALQRTRAAGYPLGARAVRVYELSVPLTPMLANLLVPISSVHQVKWRALRRYRSQQAAFGWLPREERYLSSLYAWPGRVEVFWELSPGAYSQAIDRWRWLPTGRRSPFRGLRPRPFTDGLAWMQGLRLRRRIKATAGR